MDVGEITPSPSSSRYSISFTPESSCSYEGLAGDGQFTPHSRGGGNFTAWFEIERNKLLCDLQQMVNRYNDCFCLLKDAVTGVKILRQENLQLAADNLELEILIEDKEKKERENASPELGASPVFRSVKGKEMIAAGGKVGSDLDSPGGSGSGSGSGSRTGTGSGSGSVTGSGSGSGSGSDGAPRKGGMPKCISIRSTKFLAPKHLQTGGAHRLRLPTPPVLHGGDEKEEEVELEVYNQGTVKTELCNKWGEMRWCPYGTRCQFAHGIEELKPVIRHPRYKTQQCRMMGDGGDCPYGHRCHFRHALPNPKQ